MPFVALSDPLLRIALMAGLGAIVLSMLLLVFIVALRLMLIEHQRHERRFLAIWRPLIFAAMEHEPTELPELKKSERMAFLKLWNHYQESVRGESKIRLNHMALRCGIEQFARAMLRDRSVRARLIAIFTLGHLRDDSAWQDLAALAAEPHPLVSICAARALLQIDSARALPALMPALAERGDWSIAKVTSMLAEAGADAITQPLIDAITAATDTTDAVAKLTRLLHFLDAAHLEQASSAILQVLSTATNHDIVAACLRALRDPRGLVFARALLEHPAWFVRVQAARALGRLGSAEDRGLLVAKLGDPQWWVRYRAAQAIVSLLATDRDALEKICAGISDRFAADILAQAIAEVTVG